MSRELDFKIRPVETAKSTITQRPQMGEVIPAHPFRWYIVGASGSGKTVLICNLISRGAFYGPERKGGSGYFDRVFVFSGTAGTLDDSYDGCGIPEEHFLPLNPVAINKIFEIQQKAISSRGFEHSPKVLMIFDDFQASSPKFLNSQAFLASFLQSRHYNCSILIAGQAYHRLPKSLRLNCSAISYFRGSLKETETLVEDYTASGLNKKQMLRLVLDCTEARHSFLFVDLHRPLESRYKCGFEDIAQINHYRLL
jgi:hypothetical protein